MSATFLLSFTFSYLVAFFVTRPQWKTPTMEDYQDCNTRLCTSVKEISKCTEVACIAKIIFKNNIRAQGYIFWHNSTKVKYLFIVPFIATWREGIPAGSLLYSNSRSLIFETLLSHGLFELFAGFMAASLYYSLIVGVYLLIRKKNELNLKEILMSSVFQIFIILVLYLLAAILESHGIGRKIGLVSFF